EARGSISIAQLAVAVWTLILRFFTLSPVAGRRPSASGPARGSLRHEQGNDRLLERPRDDGRDTRGRPARRTLYRARAQSRRGRERLQRTRLEIPAGH